MNKASPKSKEYEERNTQRMRDIGVRIGQARQRLNLSQGQLGELIEESQQAIQKWESGDTARKMTATALAELAKALQVSTDWLLFGGDETPKSVSMRDCCKMLFRDLPTLVPCTWKVHNPTTDDYPYPVFGGKACLVKDPPTLTYRLTIPTEPLERKFLSEEYAYSNWDYQAFLSCAMEAQHLEDIRKSNEKYFHESDYAKLFEQVPNKPLKQ